jgi:hypothetical protein
MMEISEENNNCYQNIIDGSGIVGGGHQQQQQFSVSRMSNGDTIRSTTTNGCSVLVGTPPTSTTIIKGFLN